MRRGEPPNIGGSPGRMDAKEADAVNPVPLEAMRVEDGRLVPNKRCPACRADALEFSHSEEKHNVYGCVACGKEHYYIFAVMPRYGSRARFTYMDRG